MAVGEQLSDGQSPLEGDVTAVYLPRPRRCGEVAPVYERYGRLAGTERQTGREIKTVDAGPGPDTDLYRLPAVSKSGGRKAQSREDDALARMIQYHHLRCAADERQRRVSRGRPAGLKLK